MTTTTLGPVPAAADADLQEESPAASPAASRADRFQTLQVLLFTVGAVLMPAGVIAVGFGWWGAAHSRYAYDQFPYLLSGGLLGVCLTTLGGFLYFGAWQAKVASDQKQALKQLSESIHDLATAVSRQAGAGEHDDAVPVVAGTKGTTVHRRDCALIAHRQDLRVVTGADTGLTTCRVCNPTVPAGE